VFLTVGSGCIASAFIIMFVEKGYAVKTIVIDLGWILNYSFYFYHVSPECVVATFFGLCLVVSVVKSSQQIKHAYIK
jgi:hypothetical protein